jgi:Glyoxalase superfamily protein/ClpX C4-type zinc finger
MRTYNDARATAKLLRASLAARRVLLSHSACLEIVAKQFGFADWNTFSAKLDLGSGSLAQPDHSKSALQPAHQNGARRMSRTAAPEQLSCSFCGKSQHEVRSLIEGACRNRGISQCIFICDECVEFCAQINAATIGRASSQQGRSTP